MTDYGRPSPTQLPAYGRVYTSDNRWSPGASDDNQVGSPDPPTDAPAMYSGRWIDQGIGMDADVVPDRHGIAYDTDDQRARLIEAMTAFHPEVLIGEQDLPRDETVYLVQDPRLHVRVRRAGGYYYVDAWVPAP